MAKKMLAQLKCSSNQPPTIGPSDHARGAEDGEPREQHSLAADPVGQGARRQQQGGEDQVVRVDHPLQLARGGAQLAYQGGQCDVDQRRIQVNDEGG